MAHPLRRLRRAASSFRQSLLFVPFLLTLGALLLFSATSVVDNRLAPSLVRLGPAQTFLLFGGGSGAASTLLSSIASTMATIAGVVYSVTLVTIQLSATKYSAQVVRAFERDRLNQVVLGVFTGTFVYALLVLKTVRVADGGTFVPLLGVNVAIGLAVLALFLLIAFIGNLTAYIRPTRFVQDLAVRGRRDVARLREPAGLDGFAAAEGPAAPEPLRAVVRADDDGNLEPVKWARLRRALARSGRLPARLRLEAKSGARVMEGQALVALEGREVPEGLEDALAGALPIAKVRDVAGDPAYVAEVLGDIGVTALSPGGTDVGVAKEVAYGLLRLAAEDLRAEPVATRFRLDLGPGVVVERPAHHLHVGCFVELQRILDHARERGHWDVGEAFTKHVRVVLLAAAGSPSAGAWERTLGWLPSALARALAAEDPGARERMAGDLARAAAALREEGHEARARAVEDLALEQAREQGWAPEDAARVAEPPQP